RDSFLQSAPRGATRPHGLGAGERRLLDVHRRGHAQALLRPLLHQAPVAPFRPVDPVRHREVRAVRESSGMSRVKPFPLSGTATPRVEPRHVTSAARVFTTCAKAAKNGYGMPLAMER